MDLINYKKIIQTSIICSICLYSIAVSVPENFQEHIDLSSSSVIFLADFENEDVIKNIKTYHDISEIKLNSDKNFVKNGNHSLKVIVASKDPNSEGRVVLDLTLNKSKDMSEYRALTFWLYIPGELRDYFYGRNDVQLFPNASDPRYIKAAVTSGWNKIYWDFKDLYTFPELLKIRIDIGPILSGSKCGEIYMDDICLEKMPSLDVNEPKKLQDIIKNDNDWSKRYQAVKLLEEKNEIEFIETILDATADGVGDFGISPTAAATAQAVAEVKTSGSQAVRSAAKAALKSAINKYSNDIRPILSNGLNSLDVRVRLAIIETLSEVSSENVNAWIIEELEKALFDNDFYVRQAAMNALEMRGYNKSKITEYALGYFNSKDNVLALEAIRLLSEIGPGAKSAISELMKTVRDNSFSLNTRCQAVKAVWKIDESYLQPEDWLIVLAIKPGDIHRHLFNVAMDRLEKAGENSVNALTEALKSENPEIRARAASILMAIGNNANNAILPLETCLQDKEWFVRWQAAQAIKAISQDCTKADIVLSEVQDFKNKSENEEVRAIQKDGEVLLDNGIIQIVFDANDSNPGPKIVRMGDWGLNLFDNKWIEKMMAFKDSPADSILERAWFQKVFGTPVNKNFKGTLTASTKEFAEYTYTFPANDTVFIEWTLHYVLRKNDSGFYMYVTAKNASGKNYEDSTNPRNRNSLGEFRLLVPLTWGLYDTVIMHDKLQGPSRYTFIPHGFMPFSDIYQCTYRVSSGEIDAKHEWDNYELLSPVIGYCNQEQGLWFIMPDYESLDGSIPTLSVHSANRNMFVIHLEGKYYVNTATKITKDFDKLYGPFYFYINSGESREELWIDAKRKADDEKSKWPYKWISNEQFHQRGIVKGRVEIDGNYSSEDSWIILANPREDVSEDYYGQWLHNIAPYKYWTKTAADGIFEIDNVRTGSYNIFVWKEGVFGELRKDNVIVNENKVNDVGLLTLKPIHKGESVWQIGIPNRNPTEFRNGNNFHQWDNYLSYQENFPNDVNYTIGESDYTKDWNYVQPAAIQGRWKPTTWTVNFNLEKNPDKDGLLTVVCAGRNANMDVVLNGSKIGDISITVKHIGGHIRSAPYCELFVKEFKIKKELLKTGNNKILFTFAKGMTDTSASDIKDMHFKEWASYISYDFLRFELLDN